MKGGGKDGREKARENKPRKLKEKKKTEGNEKYSNEAEKGIKNGL